MVICTYDNAAGLDRTLLALGRSQAADGRWGVLVVDNNSSDDTPAVIERHRRSGALPSLASVQEPRQGLTWARLRGVRSTTAPWVAFVDDDCVVDEQWVGCAVAFARAHPDAGAFGGRVVLDLEAGSDALPAGYGWLFAEQELGSTARPVEHLVGTGLVLNRGALEACGWVDGPLLSDRVGRRLVSGGDVELVVRVANGGRALWYVPACVLHHGIPARRTAPRYLLRLATGLGVSASLASALGWPGSRPEWAVAVVRAGARPLVRAVRRVARAPRGRPQRLDALLAVGFELGRWAGALRVAVLLARGRCDFFGRGAAGR